MAIVAVVCAYGAEQTNQPTSSIKTKKQSIEQRESASNKIHGRRERIKKTTHATTIHIVHIERDTQKILSEENNYRIKNKNQYPNNKLYT